MKTEQKTSFIKEHARQVKEIYDRCLNMSEGEVHELFLNINHATMVKLTRHYTDNQRLNAVSYSSRCPYSINEFLNQCLNCETMDESRYDKIYDVFQRFAPEYVYDLLNIGKDRPFGAKAASIYRKKYIDFVLDNYNINNNWYDFSCGWGQRLLVGMNRGVNYFGTDPNENLCKSLRRMHADFNRHLNKSAFADIRCEGSQTYIQEWKNKMGLAFTSPPYFNFEIYETDKQCIGTIEDWKEQYVRPTISNIYEYLIEGGYLVINISNSKGIKHDMEKIFYDAAIERGFKYVETKDIYQSSNGIGQHEQKKKKSEKFYIFKKGEGAEVYSDTIALF